jgi:hypothetical protein
MKKRNYWPLFFIGIFSFVFSMIIWTIMSAVSVPVIEDRSFMKKYQDVDENYNNMMDSNSAFLDKYSFELYLNEKKFDLSTTDMMYAQRVIEKHSKHKDSLKVGENSLKIVIIDKQTNEKKDVDVSLIVTKSIADDSDIVLNSEKFLNDNKIYSTKFEIKESNNWNISGSFKVGENIGYIFIKTNAI